MTERLRHGILLLTLAHHVAVAQPAPAPTKVVGAQGVWWILDDQGGLRSFDGRGSIAQRLGGPVRDIARLPNDRLLTLIERRKPSGGIVMEDVGGGAWREFANVSIDAGDSLIGLTVSGNGAIIVTSHAIYSLRRHGLRHRQPIHGVFISARLQPAIALTASGQLYVGENAGEWGGGLIRVNVVTGVSRYVERRDNGCDGPLNRECNPVTAVILDPNDGRCVIASIGLRHVMELGRVLRVCGTRLSVVAELPCPGRPAAEHCSLGMFGLARDGRSGFWAVSGSTLYHFRGDTIDQQVPIPKFQNRAGLAYSEAIPGLLVLSTDINWRKSVSGPTPLIGSR